MADAKQPTGPSRKNNHRPFQRTQASRDGKASSQRPTTSRASSIATQNISLTFQDPIERLKQFCEQGKYTFHWNWDRFASGIVCEVEISYQLDSVKKGSDRRKVLTREARYIPNTESDSDNSASENFKSRNLLYAQRVLAAIVLDRLGLGVPAEDSEPREDQVEDACVEQETSERDSEDTGVYVENMMKNLAVAAITKLGGEFDMDAILAAVQDNAKAPGSDTGTDTQSTTKLRWADIVKDGLGGL